MGCTFAHPRNGEINPRVFKVVNVDSEGREINPGKIEITDVELIFHQKDKPPIQWPLRGLRRYGFDTELFTFESGRRCPTGVGVYAFQCQRAEALFNLLQDCVQRAGQDDNPISHSVSPQPPVPLDRPNSMSNIDTASPVRLAGSDGPPMMMIARNRSSQAITANGMVSLQTFPSMSSPNAHEYINTDIVQSTPSELSTGVGQVDLPDINLRVSHSGNSVGNTNAESRIQYAQLDLHRNSMDTQLLTVDNNNSSQVTYMNIHADGDKEKPRSSSLTTVTASSARSNTPPLLHVVSMPDPQHEYLNLSLQKNSSYSSSAGKCPQYIPARPPMVQKNDAKDPTVTYIEVDFNNSEEMNAACGSSRVVNGIGDSDGSVRQSNGISRNVIGGLAQLPPSTQRTESYAVIDFNKTAAINAKNARDDGGRKTRHDSSIEELL